VDLVRYEAKGNNKEYWLKDEKILNMLDMAEELADRMRKKRE
jgi:hypothetical protein